MPRLTTAEPSTVSSALSCSVDPASFTRFTKWDIHFPPRYIASQDPLQPSGKHTTVVLWVAATLPRPWVPDTSFCCASLELLCCLRSTAEVRTQVRPPFCGYFFVFKLSLWWETWPSLSSDEIGPDDCCFDFYPRPLNKKYVRSYYMADRRCPKAAVMWVKLCTFFYVFIYLFVCFVSDDDPSVLSNCLARTWQRPNHSTTLQSLVPGDVKALFGKPRDFP